MPRLVKAYKYKFNGQEWQDELGLNITAMDYRQYDNAIGRFNSIDVLSEFNYSQSPYHFADNNPISVADPTGLDGRGAGGIYTNAYGVANYQGYDGYNTPMSSFGAFSGGYMSMADPGAGSYFYSEDTAAISDIYNYYSIQNGFPQQRVWNDGYTPSGDGFTTFSGENKMGEIGLGYWESMLDYTGYYLTSLEAKAGLDAYSSFNYGTSLQSATELTAANTARMSNIAKWAGRGGTALQVIPVGIGYYKDGWTVGKHTREESVRASGAIVAGIAGAQIGFAVGVWFGGIGAIPGAAVGTVLGVVVGAVSSYYGGEATVGAYHYIID